MCEDRFKWCSARTTQVTHGYRSHDLSVSTLQLTQMLPAVHRWLQNLCRCYCPKHWTPSPTNLLDFTTFLRSPWVLFWIEVLHKCPQWMVLGYKSIDWLPSMRKSELWLPSWGDEDYLKYRRSVEKWLRTTVSTFISLQTSSSFATTSLSDLSSLLALLVP